MKKVVSVVLSLFLVFAMTVACVNAGPYVGVQVGASIPVANGTSVDGNGITNPSFSSNVAGGVQVGYDFLGNKRYPNMQYFSFAVDYMANGLYVNNAITRTTGAQHSLALLASLKLPMAKSNEFPNGRFFPYVSVGPTLNFTSLNRSDATNIGVLVEPGVKYFVTKKVSTDLAYRMNYTEVNLSNSNDFKNVKFKNANNMVIFRVAYNF